MRTLVPLYVHPVVDPDAWSRVARLGDAVTVVVNVHNGPGDGTDPDPVYSEATARLAAAGVAMLGYVDVDYCARPERLVHEDIRRWARYPVGGVFVDRVPTGLTGLGTVARACGVASGTVALNPGTRPDPAYLDLADIVCTYEGPWSGYDPVARSEKEAHIVYGVPVHRWHEAHALVAASVRYGFVTDRDAPLPYLGLPSRFATEGMLA